MVLEEYLVLIKGPSGNSQGQFTYWVDPHKKPNIKSVLTDFKSRSHIANVREWKVCTLGGGEIRFLADYADRILVLKPLAEDLLKLPALNSTTTRRDVTPDDDDARRRHLSQSFTTLPSLTSSSATSHSQSSDAATTASTKIATKLRRSQSTDANVVAVYNKESTLNGNNIVNNGGRRRRRRKKMSSTNASIANSRESVDMIDSNSRSLQKTVVNSGGGGDNGPVIKTSKRKTKL